MAQLSVTKPLSIKLKLNHKLLPCGSEYNHFYKLFLPLKKGFFLGFNYSIMMIF